jgi:protein PsiE
MPDLQRTSQKALRTVEMIVLAVISVATVVAIGDEVGTMIARARVTLADLLLLFLYLEVLTMVSAYVESHRLPVRMPIYIAIVALARYMVLDVKSLDNGALLAISAAVLILALAVLAIRYGHVRFPYERDIRSGSRFGGPE